jgi:hypothetical protein
LLKNFKEAKISKKPITILKLTIQLPDLGKVCKKLGNKDKKKKGKAKASPYPNIPTRGKNHSPLAAEIKTVPKKGIVQVKVVSVKVNPIKRVGKIPVKFVCPRRFKIKVGILTSKNPIRLSANNKNKIPIMRFKIG